MLARYIVGLDSRRALDPQLAGGKGAGLAWLRHYHFHVPPGFIITPNAFRDFLTGFGVEEIARKNRWSPSELRLITHFLQEQPVPGPLVAPLVRAYRRLGGPVAVRSSMVGEDTATASFAGQLETTLQVTGEAVLLAAVKRCWASLFNERLLAYLLQREQITLNTILDSFSIAVIVQRMVPAQAAGVAFSADPLTGQRCVIIEAVPGLGEALVSGRATPDRYVVDARGVLAEVHPAAGEAFLPTATVLELAELVRRVHQRMAQPQDVEWAWDGTALFLLQSRPITALIGQRIYSTAMVSEMIPGLVKPLVWSVNTTGVLQNTMGRVFTALIGPNDIDFTRLARRIHSRVYTDMTMLGELLERMGLPANAFEMMLHDEQATRHGRMTLNWKTVRTLGRMVRFALHYGRAAGEIAAFVVEHQQTIVPYSQADWSAEETPALLARIEVLQALYHRSLWVNFVGPINMMIRNRILKQLAAAWVPEVAPTDVVQGALGVKSLESNRELQKLALQARGLEPAVLQLMLGGNDTAIRAALALSPAGEALLAAMEAFLRRYGFFSASGTDLSRTPWVENPALIWQAIGRAALDPRPAPAEVAETGRPCPYQAVLDRLKGARRAIFKRILGSTLTYLHLREQTSLLISQDSYELRRLFLALADRWCADGKLATRDDIFYLTLAEIHQGASGQLAGPALRAWVAQRRAEMEADAVLDLPDTIWGDHVPAVPRPAAEPCEYLTGIIGSAGFVAGRARIVLDPAQAPAQLTPEDILVVPFTDVSWTPLFAGIGGLVAETGGQLSHSAIVAREYGLPAVVNVKHATRLIQEGQPVSVDGNQGRVYLHG